MADAPASTTGPGSASSLLAAAAHDLRQPLQGLRLLVGVVANEASATRRQQSAVRMDASIGSLLAMLERLGEVALLESQGLSARSSTFQLDDLLGAIVAELTPVVAGRTGRVTATMCNVVIDSDRLLLHEAVKGLVLNAIWLDPGSQLVLSARPAGQQAEIEVAVDRVLPAAAGPARVFTELDYMSGGLPALSTGLGLRAVVHVARLLGYAVDTTNTPAGAMTFTLRPMSG